MCGRDIDSQRQTGRDNGNIIDRQPMGLPAWIANRADKERTRCITWAKTSESVPIVAKGVQHVFFFFFGGGGGGGTEEGHPGRLF